MYVFNFKNELEKKISFNLGEKLEFYFNKSNNYFLLFNRDLQKLKLFDNFFKEIDEYMLNNEEVIGLITNKNLLICKKNNNIFLYNLIDKSKKILGESLDINSSFIFNEEILIEISSINKIKYFNLDNSKDITIRNNLFEKIIFFDLYDSDLYIYDCDNNILSKKKINN